MNITPLNYCHSNTPTCFSDEEDSSCLPKENLLPLQWVCWPKVTHLFYQAGLINRSCEWILDMSKYRLPVLGNQSLERLKEVFARSICLGHKDLRCLPENKRKRLLQALDCFNNKCSQLNCKKPFEISVCGNFISKNLTMNIFDLFSFLLKKHGNVIERIEVFGGAVPCILGKEFYKSGMSILESLGMEKINLTEFYEELKIAPPDVDLKIIASKASVQEIESIVETIIDYFIEDIPFSNKYKRFLQYIYREILFDKKSLVYSQENGQKNLFQILSFHDQGGCDIDLLIVQSMANKQLFNCHGLCLNVTPFLLAVSQIDGRSLSLQEKSVELVPESDIAYGWQAFFDRMTKTLSVENLNFFYYLGWEKFVVFISRGYCSPNDELDRTLLLNTPSISNHKLDTLYRNLINCASQHSLKGYFSSAIVLLNTSIMLRHLPKNKVSSLWAFLREQENQFDDYLAYPWVRYLVEHMSEGILDIEDVIDTFEVIVTLIEFLQEENLHFFKNSCDTKNGYKHINFKAINHHSHDALKFVGSKELLHKTVGVVRIPYHFNSTFQTIERYFDCSCLAKIGLLESLCAYFFTPDLNVPFKNRAGRAIFHLNRNESLSIKNFFCFMLNVHEKNQNSSDIYLDFLDLVISDLDFDLRKYCFYILKKYFRYPSAFEKFHEKFAEAITDKSSYEQLKQGALFDLIKDLAASKDEQQMNLAYLFWKSLEFSFEVNRDIRRHLCCFLPIDSALSIFIETLQTLNFVTEQDLKIYDRIILEATSPRWIREKIEDLAIATGLVVENLTDDQNFNLEDVLWVLERLLEQSKADIAWNLIMKCAYKKWMANRNYLAFCALDCLKQNFKGKLPLISIIRQWEEGTQMNLFEPIIDNSNYISLLIELAERAYAEGHSEVGDLFFCQIHKKNSHFPKQTRLAKCYVEKQLAAGLCTTDMLNSYSKYFMEEELLEYSFSILKFQIQEKMYFKAYYTLYETFFKFKIPLDDPCFKESLNDLLNHLGSFRKKDVIFSLLKLIADPAFQKIYSKAEIKEIYIKILTSIFNQQGSLQMEEISALSDALESVEIGDSHYVSLLNQFVLTVVNSSLYHQNSLNKFIYILNIRLGAIFKTLFYLNKDLDVFVLFHALSIANYKNFNLQQHVDLVVSCIDRTLISLRALSAQVLDQDLSNSMVACIHDLAQFCGNYKFPTHTFDKMIEYLFAHKYYAKIEYFLKSVMNQQEAAYIKESLLLAIGCFPAHAVTSLLHVLSLAYEKNIIERKQAFEVALKYLNLCCNQNFDETAIKILEWMYQYHMDEAPVVLTDYIGKQIAKKEIHSLGFLIDFLASTSICDAKLWNTLNSHPLILENHALSYKLFMLLSHRISSASLVGELSEICRSWDAVLRYTKTCDLFLNIFSKNLCLLQRHSFEVENLAVYQLFEILKSDTVPFRYKMELIEKLIEAMLDTIKSYQKQMHLPQNFDFIMILFLKIHKKILEVMPDSHWENSKILEHEFLQYSLTTMNEIYYSESLSYFIRRSEFKQNPLFFELLLHYPKILRSNTDREKIELLIFEGLVEIMDLIPDTKENCIKICCLFSKTVSLKFLESMSHFLLNLFNHIKNDLSPPDFMEQLIRKFLPTSQAWFILNHPTVISMYQPHVISKLWAELFIEAHQSIDSNELALQVFQLTNRYLSKIANDEENLKNVWNVYWKNILFLYQQTEFYQELSLLFSEAIEMVYGPNLIASGAKQKSDALLNELIEIIFTQKTMPIHKLQLIIDFLYESILKSLIHNVNFDRSLLIENFIFFSLNFKDDTIFEKIILLGKNLYQTGIVCGAFANSIDRLLRCVLMTEGKGVYGYGFDGKNVQCINKKQKEQTFIKLIKKLTDSGNPVVIRHAFIIMALSSVEILSQKFTLITEVYENLFKAVSKYAYDLIQYKSPNAPLQLSSKEKLVPLHESIRQLIMYEDRPLFKGPSLMGAKIFGCNLIKLYLNMLLEVSLLDSDLAVKQKIPEVVLHVLTVGSNTEIFFKNHEEYLFFLDRIQSMVLQRILAVDDFEAVYKMYEILLFKPQDLKEKIQLKKINIIHAWICSLLKSSKHCENLEKRALLYTRVNKTMQFAFTKNLYQGQNHLIKELKQLREDVRL